MLAVCVQQATNIHAEHSKKPMICVGKWFLPTSQSSGAVRRLASALLVLACVYICVLLYVYISFREKHQNLYCPYCSIY